MWEIASTQLVGDRSYQEDAATLLRLREGRCWLMLIADGAGGHGQGDLASAAVVSAAEALWQRYPQDWTDARSFLADLANEANQQVRSATGNAAEGGDRAIQGATEADAATDADKDTSGRSTIVALLVDGERADWIHLGDSRLYLVRNGKVVKRTRDHSVVQLLVDRGSITFSELRSHPDRSKLTHALGTARAPEPDHDSAELEKGDSFLLCSDGFWESITSAESAKILATRSSLQDKLNLAAAEVMRRNPHSDNITVSAARQIAKPNKMLVAAALATFALVLVAWGAWEITAGSGDNAIAGADGENDGSNGSHPAPPIGGQAGSTPPTSPPPAPVPPPPTPTAQAGASNPPPAANPPQPQPEPAPGQGADAAGARDKVAIPRPPPTAPNGPAPAIPDPEKKGETDPGSASPGDDIPTLVPNPNVPPKSVGSPGAPAAQDKQQVPAISSNQVGMHLVKIEPGSVPVFDENSLSPDKARERRVAETFSIGTTEVTRTQYAWILSENRDRPLPANAGADDGNLPVTGISFQDALRFCELLTEVERGQGLSADLSYQLPTDLQWEYVARAGSTGIMPTEKELQDGAWMLGEDAAEPKPVATRKPNNWGCYDLFGNAAEMCYDSRRPGAIDAVKLVGADISWAPVPLRYQDFSSADGGVANSLSGFRVILKRTGAEP